MCCIVRIPITGCNICYRWLGTGKYSYFMLSGSITHGLPNIHYITVHYLLYYISFARLLQQTYCFRTLYSWSQTNKRSYFHIPVRQERTILDHSRYPKLGPQAFLEIPKYGHVLGQSVDISISKTPNSYPNSNDYYTYFFIFRNNGELFSWF